MAHPRSLWKRVLMTASTPMGMLSVAGTVVLLVLAVIAPVLWGDTAVLGHPTRLSQGASAQHWLGTDAGGRDILARTLVATRLSVLMALAATAIGVSTGVLVGSLPVVCGRRLARLLTATVNLAIAFPALLLIIILSVIMGTGSRGAILAIGLAMMPAYGRLTQTLCASVAGRDFVLAARVLGVPRWRILSRHVLPNVREPLIVNASISAGGALTAFAGLSFLGLGVQPPEYDWGRLLNEGVATIYVTPGAAIAPALAVVFAGVTFNVLGEALARSLGVRRRGSTVGRHRRRLEATGSRARTPESAEANVLTVRNLRVGVPDGDSWTYPVKGVSFSVARGEIVGLVGESGSGKSLTCLSVAGLVEGPLAVMADQVEFDGEELTKAGVVPGLIRSAKTARHLGRRMAMVFQDPMSSLNPALKVGVQVAEVGVLHGGLSARAALRRAVQRLGDVHISDPNRRARQYPHELSGGMRQRAMIAMGLMGKPALIIADEPTTALDVTVQREVLRLLSSVNTDTGCGVLLVSHDIAVVTGLCTRVLVMYDGRIVEDVAAPDLVEGRARHPYTRALLAAVPSMTSNRDEPLATISDRTTFGSGRFEDDEMIVSEGASR